ACAGNAKQSEDDQGRHPLRKYLLPKDGSSRTPARSITSRGQAFLRPLVAIVAGSVARSSFFLRPPGTGRSNALWRRSGAALARLLVLASFAAGGSCTRLRFSAAIRSMTGAGVEISRGSIGSPFTLASISSRNDSW